MHKNILPDCYNRGETNFEWEFLGMIFNVPKTHQSIITHNALALLFGTQ